MPPNNSNLTSALTRQMRHLRLHVDQIDLKILKLLQQRIKLSTRIGQVKRRHKAPVYVPEREGELRARVAKLSQGKLPARAVDSIYREILSNSRAAQGQAPLGLLQSSADVIMPPARWHFGACDEFLPKKSWSELATGLKAGKLTLALLTGEDLARVLQTDSIRRSFLAHFNIVDDFSPTPALKVPLAQRILIVTPRNQGVTCAADRVLILIECKSTLIAVKRLLNCMSDRSIQAEALPLHGRAVRSAIPALVRLILPQRIDAAKATDHLLAAGKASGIAISLLGVYPGTENYGG